MSIASLPGISRDIPFLDLTVFKQLLPQQRADIIRIYLLNTFGGIWLDCDVFIYNISFFKSLIKRISLKYTFYSPRSCVRRLPSNWFIFSQRQSRISTILLDKLYASLESDSLYDIPYTYFGSLLFLSSMKEFGLYYNFPFDFFFFQRLPYYVSSLYFTTSPFSSLLFPNCLSPLVNISASSFNRDYLNRMISYELMQAHGQCSSSTLLSRLFRSSSSQIS